MTHLTINVSLRNLALVSLTNMNGEDGIALLDFFLSSDCIENISALNTEK